MLGIASWVLSDKVHITLRDVLDIEHAYPGLMSDIDKCIWQVMLITEQQKAQADG